MFKAQSLKLLSLAVMLVAGVIGCQDPDSGTKAPGTTAPVVVGVVPVGASNGACPNATVSVTFSEAMNATTITTSNFTLTGGGTTVTGTVGHNAAGTVFTFTPVGNLAPGVTYTATITTAATDLYGNKLAANYVTTFTTAANSCMPPPIVTVVSPLAGATGVCPNTILTATFNEAMNAATINGTTFTLQGPGTTAVTGAVTYSALTNTAIFSPAVPLALNTKYTATITQGALDLFTNPLAAPFVWTFTTNGTTCQAPNPPIGVTPPNGFTGVCQNTVLVASFGQAMNPLTLNNATFTLQGPGTTAVAGAITHDAANKIYTFTPTLALALNTLYTATITTGAQDPNGNALANNYSWSFTTAAVACTNPPPPAVIAVTPPNGATGVCPNTNITATFNEVMNPATINTLTFFVSPGVIGVVTLDPTGRVAIFTPTAPLALNTLYTATISTGAKDLGGNALPANYVWSFTTAVQNCQSPVPLGSAANFEVLGGSTVTNTGPTVITGGDLGLSPGSAVTGFPPGTLTAPAKFQVTNPIAAQGQLDLTIAYLYTQGLQGGAVLPADLKGLTFTPGLYKNSSTVMLSSGAVTLDGLGNPNAVFIFQVSSTLTTLSGTQVILAGGTQAKNVFWAVGSSATLGTTSIFKGTIMSAQSITVQTGAAVTGRMLTQIGAVTLDTNIINVP